MKGFKHCEVQCQEELVAYKLATDVETAVTCYFPEIFTQYFPKETAELMQEQKPNGIVKPSL